MQNQYSTQQVSRLLKLPEHRVRRFARAGAIGRAVQPAALNARYRFEFRDVAVLRMAAKLLSEGFSSARVQRVLQFVRDQLPEDLPLSGMQIFSEDDRILVRSDGRIWEPESGQLQLVLDASVAGTVPSQELQPFTLPEMEQPAITSLDDVEQLDDYAAAEAWFEMAVHLETHEPQKAYDAYSRVVLCNPEHVEGLINLGTLCSEAGELQRAAAFFRQAIRVDDNQPVALYNLAVTYHDLGQIQHAIESYQGALRCDGDFADAHFNLASLLESEGRRNEAVRHLRAYELICERAREDEKERT